MYKILLFTILAIIAVRAQVTYTSCPDGCADKCASTSCFRATGAASGTTNPCECVNCTTTCKDGCRCALAEKVVENTKQYYCNQECPQTCAPTQSGSSLLCGGVAHPCPSVTGTCSLVDTVCKWQVQCPARECKFTVDEVAKTSTCGDATIKCIPPSTTTAACVPSDANPTGCKWAYACPVIEPVRCVREGDMCGDVARPECVKPAERSLTPGCTTVEGKCVWKENCYTPTTTTTCKNDVTTCGDKPKPDCPLGYLEGPSCCCTTNNAGTTTTTCGWAAKCKVATPCDRCVSPCSSTQELVGGVCKQTSEPSAAEIKCAYVDSKCVDKVPTCDCTNSQRLPCPAGSIPDPAASASCKYSYQDGKCVAYPICIPDDSCFAKFGYDYCRCDYTKCVYSVDWKRCVSPSSSLLAYAKELFKQRPASCEASTTTTTKPVGDVVDKVTTGVTDATKVSTALDTFKQDLSDASKPDAATGINKASQFSVIIIVILNPTKTGSTIEMSTLATFIPTTLDVTVLDADHKRIYCAIIQKLFANVGGVKVEALSDCTWTKQASVKRQASGTGEDEKISVSFPESALTTSPASHQTLSFILVAVLVLISLFMF